MGTVGEPDKCKPNDQRGGNGIGIAVRGKRRINDEYKRRNPSKIRGDECGRELYKGMHNVRTTSISMEQSLQIVGRKSSHGI